MIKEKIAKLKDLKAEYRKFVRETNIKKENFRIKIDLLEEEIMEETNLKLFEPKE